MSSKLDDIGSALSKSYAAMNCVWPTVKAGGDPGEIRMLREAIMACEAVLLEPGESSFPRGDIPKGRDDRHGDS